MSYVVYANVGDHFEWVSGPETVTPDWFDAQLFSNRGEAREMAEEVNGGVIEAVRAPLT